MTNEQKNQICSIINIEHDNTIAHVYQKCKDEGLIQNTRDEDIFYELYILINKRIRLYDELSEIEDLINHQFNRKD